MANAADDYFSGRGAQVNPTSRFLKQEYAAEHIEGLDEPMLEDRLTKYILDHPKSILNKVPATDIPYSYSMNPYAGCEHGCIYCYARDTHEYLGHSSGLDFERIIYYRPNAPSLLDYKLSSKSWMPTPVMLSGNTDCYQPIEQEHKITRRILEVFLKHKHPVGIITKNKLVLRDKDILQELAQQNLVQVMITITTLNEALRRKLEPRTVTGKKRIETIAKLHEAGIPVGVMVAPVIPGLNSDEIPKIIQGAADAGANTVGMTVLRLSGSIGTLFGDWLEKNYPDRKEKVLNQVKECHGGDPADLKIGTRMTGQGQIAGAIQQMFSLAKKTHMGDKPKFEFNLDAYKRTISDQLSLFE